MRRRRLREVCDRVAEITGRAAPDVLDELLTAAGTQCDRPAHENEIIVELAHDFWAFVELSGAEADDASV